MERKRKVIVAVGDSHRMLSASRHAATLNYELWQGVDAPSTANRRLLPTISMMAKCFSSAPVNVDWCYLMASTHTHTHTYTHTHTHTYTLYSSLAAIGSHRQLCNINHLSFPVFFFFCIDEKCLQHGHDWVIFND